MNTNFYIPQSPHIQDIIHSFWQVDYSPSFRQEYIIPKGVVELIFNFSKGGTVQAQLGSSQYNLTRGFINGFNKTPVKIQLPEKQIFFGVQLQPMAVKKIFRTPAKEFAGMLIDAALLDSSFNSLWHQLAAESSFEKRVEVFSNWAQKKSFSWQPQEKLVNDFLYAAGGHEVSVTQLAGSVYYSPRHLSRKLFEATGMNAEEILLYKKYLRAVHLMHHTALSLTEIAYQSNFSDQSHFIKSFKAFAHITPGEYYKSKGYVKGHLYKDVR